MQFGLVKPKEGRSFAIDQVWTIANQDFRTNPKKLWKEVHRAARKENCVQVLHAPDGFLCGRGGFVCKVNAIDLR